MLVSKLSTNLVQLDQNIVVNFLYLRHYSLLLIIETVLVSLFKHVSAYCGVVGVAENFDPKKYFYHWERKTHSHCINKNITWEHSHSFVASSNERN